MNDRKKVFALILILCLVLAAFTACSNSSGSGKESESKKESTVADSANTESAESVEKESRKTKKYNAVKLGGLEFKIPDYLEDENSDDETSKMFYAEKGDKLSYMQLQSFDINGTEADFSEGYESVINNFVEALAEAPSESEIISSEEFRTKEGLLAAKADFVWHFVSGSKDVMLDGKFTIIHNQEHNKAVVAVFYQSRNSEYEYFDEFMTMINGAKVVVEDNGSNKESDSESDTDDSSALDPEFKKTMDDYEAWFDHYCEVLEKVKEDPSDWELASESLSLLAEEQKMLDEMEKMDQSEMNDAELAYYLEVTARIEAKLLKAAY